MAKHAHGSGSDESIPDEVYEAELVRLQGELVKVQEWVRAEKQRVLVIFEGRDAAGKGGTITRITQYLSPRVARIVALPAPTEREKGQWYFQRYIEHLPSAGEIVLLDRSDFPRDKSCGDGIAPHVVDVLAGVGAADVVDGWTPIRRLE
ncbi:hypothetical protein ACFPB1_27440, partial [Paenibacillus sp. GCM10023250]